MESSNVHTPSIRDKQAVRWVKEGILAVLLKSGLDEKWWADSMECFFFLRNVQDLLANGKTPYKRRFGESFRGSIIPFGATVEFRPTSLRDQSRLHQFGKKVFPGIFLGYALIAGVIWKGDILIADIEELKNLDASEIYPRIINAKELLITKKERIIQIPSGRWSSKIVRKRLRIPRTRSKAETKRREWRSQWGNSRRI